jgi:two-component system, OmpR family, phosphate regulon response regulator PhoB
VSLATENDTFLLVASRRAATALASRLRPRLALDGLKFCEVSDPEAALEFLARHTPGAVMLHLGAGVDPQVIADLRASTTALLLAVLPESSDESDRLLAFDLGADDVVVEPFSPVEVAARVRAARRRFRGESAIQRLRYGSLVVDLHAHEVQLGNRLLVLTHQEFALLAFFATHPRRTYTRAQLLEAAWESERAERHRATVTEHVRRLRRKFDEAGYPGDRWIITVHGVGYRFDPYVAADTAV